MFKQRLTRVNQNTIMQKYFRYTLGKQHTKRRLYSLLISSLLIGLSNLGHASDFDIRVNDDAAHANISIDSENNNLSFGGGFFYKDNDSSSTKLINLDLHTQGQTAIANQPTTVKIGVQANYLDSNSGVDSTVIGLGGGARVNLPDVPGLSIESEVHFAPNVLSFGDSERFTRFLLQSNYRIIQTADVSAGYRYISTKLDNNDRETVESGLFVGLRIQF